MPIAPEPVGETAPPAAPTTSSEPVAPEPLGTQPVAAQPAEPTTTYATVPAEPTTVTETTPPAEPVLIPPIVPTTTAPPRKRKGVKTLAILVMVSGLILMAAGVVTWIVVRNELSDEQITVSQDASHFAGDAVDGPFTAYAQADAIKQHALEAGGGKTYAQLPQDDPKRDTVMTASFLRASLYTSVVSFGVAFFAFGMGIIMLLVGWALLRINKNLRTL
jgi:hypothetical protein